MLKTFKIIFIISCSAQQLYSQVNEEWVKIYNPFNQINIPAVISLDSTGNLYMAGTTQFENGRNSLCLVKYSSNGSVIWSRNFNFSGISSDNCSGLVLDKSKNVILTGQFSIPDSLGSDIETVKYDSSGNLIWSKKFELSYLSFESAAVITCDRNNNILISGRTFAFNNPSGSLTIKYDASGNLIWDEIYSQFEYFIFAMDVDVDGNVYITGRAQIDSTGEDIVTVKYDSNGQYKWNARYNGPVNGTDEPSSLKIDNSGNILVAGRSDANNGYGYAADYVIIKYNSSGNVIWVKRFNGPYNSDDEINAMCIDFLNNIYVTGTSMVSVNNGADITTIKYDSSGNQNWVRYYNHGSLDVGNAITVDTAGSLYICGYQNQNMYYQDIIVLSYNNSGLLKWTKSYNSPSYRDDYADFIAADKFGNIFVCGNSDVFPNGFNIVTIKYSQPIGIQQISSEIPNHFSLFQNYPNPFNPSTKIKFDIPKSAFTLLKIYDILGREVATPVNEQLKPGTYEIEFSATGGGSNLPSGVYFYKLVVGDNTNNGGFDETKKMILLK